MNLTRRARIYICALLGKIPSPMSLGGWQRCSGTAWCWCDFHKHLSASGSTGILAIISFFMLCLHFGLTSGHLGFLVFGKGATWQMSERALAVIKTLQLRVQARHWHYFLTSAGSELWRRNWGVFEAWPICQEKTPVGTESCQRNDKITLAKLETTTLRSLTALSLAFVNDRLATNSDLSDFS